MQAFLVGGYVRDRVFHRETGRALPPQDRDWVVVGSTPQELLARGFKLVGADFPVFIHPDTGEEYALARTERKRGTGHRGFEVFASPEVTIDEDLSRRDLTINAMAEDAEGNLIDPFGGLRDVRARVLRHVGPAFSEDPLRVLRVARFSARFPEFRVADETADLLRTMTRSGELDTLTAERVWAEIAKALLESSPRRFIEVLREIGALRVVLPEVDRLFGVSQPPQHHPEIDTGLHTLLVLDQACRLSQDAEVRFAAIVHDLGKGVTPAEELPSHRGHDRSGVPLVEQVCAKLRAPRRFRDLAVDVCREHLRCHNALELRAGTVLGLLERTRAFRSAEQFEWFLLACEADARGRLGREDPLPAGRLPAPGA
jgi:tRNA nucleotidyltransferase (CCA-adding enzyme)